MVERYWFAPGILYGVTRHRHCSANMTLHLLLTVYDGISRFVLYFILFLLVFTIEMLML